LVLVPVIFFYSFWSLQKNLFLKIVPDPTSVMICHFCACVAHDDDRVYLSSWHPTWQGTYLKIIFQLSPQTPIPSVHNELSTDSMNLHLNVSQDSNYTVNNKASPMRLPHQLFGDTTPQNNWALTTLAEQINESHRK